MPPGFTAFHRPCELNRAAKEQQLLRQRRLAGVGVGDDCEGSPPADLLFDIGHVR